MSAKPFPFLPVVLALFCTMSGCRGSKPLPEQGTYAEALYKQRCGSCHRPYAPASLTAAMWQVQVETMRSKMAQAGQPPLSKAEIVTILNYLQRNAGQH
jgi:mono/diheme cytochrome c family protein